ncbi:hypothetical protein MA16_Dca025630 [Dendrobium catenatum]|uniref:Uncharacterized protein n=1 Tax=Dendrobium catenatum TaxID=906689 RepID=A0A2I0WKY6_9ASPA|nr:hypothetical protein MA16_Dca025630 [Dendrobium catenatum]
MSEGRKKLLGRSEEAAQTIGRLSRSLIARMLERRSRSLTTKSPEQTKPFTDTLSQPNPTRIGFNEMLGWLGSLQKWLTAWARQLAEMMKGSGRRWSARLGQGVLTETIKGEDNRITLAVSPRVFASLAALEEYKGNSAK